MRAFALGQPTFPANDIAHCRTIPLAPLALGKGLGHDLGQAFGREGPARTSVRTRNVLD